MKTQTFSFRIESELMQRLENVEAGTGIERASIVRNAVLAVVNYHEEFGEITFPLVVISGRRKPVGKAKVISGFRGSH